MEDLSINNLKILNKISKDLYRIKKSSISRIDNENYLNKKTRDFLYGEIIKNLDDDLYVLRDKIYDILKTIPIYKYFLKRINCLSIYDCCDLIVLININDFSEFKKLLSYSGMSPKKTNRYNKDLKKVLLRISKKISENDLTYNLIYESAYNHYLNENPYLEQNHIENKARRVVVKKFLKNLFKMWKSLNNEEFL